VAGALKNSGIRALFYHAGMKVEERADTQDRFMKEKNLTVILNSIRTGLRTR
jgi:superfamily II DNA helicase RecQ